MQFKNYLRSFSVALFSPIVIIMACTLSACNSFSLRSQPQCMIWHQQSISFQQRRYTSQRPLFRELISNDEEDLRADIAVIREQVGLDEFLKVDDRLCVIKWVLPHILKIFPFKSSRMMIFLNRSTSTQYQIVCTILQSMQSIWNQISQTCIREGRSDQCSPRDYSFGKSSVWRNWIQ